MPIHFRGAIAPVLRWLDSLPFSLMNERPSLWVTYGAATMISGHPSQVEPKLKAAEVALKGAPDTEKNRDLTGQIAGCARWSRHLKMILTGSSRNPRGLCNTSRPAT